MTLIHDARMRRSQAVFGRRKRVPAPASSSGGAEAGFQVPGLFKVKRDEELLSRAELLLDNWRILLRETYNLKVTPGEKIAPEEKLRAGFSAELGRQVLLGMRDYFKWWQANKDQTPGAILPQFTTELEQELKAYEGVRSQVNHVLELQGKRSASLRGERVFDPKAEGEPIVSGFQKRLLEALAVAALVALGLKIFGSGRRMAGAPPRDVVYP